MKSSTGLPRTSDARTAAVPAFSDAKRSQAGLQKAIRRLASSAKTTDGSFSAVAAAKLEEANIARTQQRIVAPALRVQLDNICTRGRYPSSFRNVHCR